MTAVPASRTRIVQADLSRQEDQDAVVAMTSAYATDPMGNAGPLPSDVLDRLIPALRAHPTTVILLAWDGEEDDAFGRCDRS